MEIEVTVPGLLADCTGNRVRFPIVADTLQGALDVLFSEYPMLKHHVFTEQGQVRKHVLLCYNEDNIAGFESLDIPLRQGDKYAIGVRWLTRIRGPQSGLFSRLNYKMK
jgi:molybdopterin synthase sulfur carrier subunit